MVGRDPFLALADRRLAEAASGDGQLVLVAGEAGIGKTRLLDAIARRAKGFTVMRAAAFPGDVQSSAGLLLDLATELPALSSLVRAEDSHRRRRLLVQDLTDLILGAAPGTPVLMILEDLHWADELSLDVLGHLAARLSSRRMLVAGAFRTDELYPRLPMRELRGRLLGQRLAEEIRLPRLRPEEIATMTGALLGRRAPARVVAALHARSDGIPLHVEELLAALPDVSDEAVESTAVPDTLADAVLSRALRLSAVARSVASAAAVIGRSFDFDLLAAVAPHEPDEVAAALRELREAYLVMPGTDAVTFDFRHALIRDALYADTDLPPRRRLHERVARTAAERGYRDAFVSAHYEQAGLGEPAHAHALAAAREAAALSAHREALELYGRAVRNLPPGLPVQDRAELYAALGDTAAAADDNRAAAQAYDSAHALALESGDVRGAAALVPRIAAVAHLLGAGLDERVAMLTSALDSLEEDDPLRGSLRSAMSAAYMLARRLDEAIAWGERSLDGEVTLGSVLVFAGRMEEGWRLLEEATARARDSRRESEAARGYRMIGSCASVLVEYDRAERHLSEGIDYAERAELWNHRHYLAAHLAHVQWATGRWEEAETTAQRVLADGRGGVTTRITAQYVLGYQALGRGDWDAAGDALRSALAEGERMAELQRLSPPLWGLAEMARCRGDHATALELCSYGYRVSAEVTDAAYLFPYLVTGVRAHLAEGENDAAARWLDSVSEVLRARGIPGTLPAIDHGRGLLLLAQGDLAAARDALETARATWSGRRRFWEEAWARIDLATLALRNRRRGEAARLLTGLPASGPLHEAAALLGQRTVDPWDPLTAREFEVAGLVAEGLTNRQIAERLVLAPKTVSAHVEHILAKLGAARRTEIAAWYTTRSRA